MDGRLRTGERSASMSEGFLQSMSFHLLNTFIFLGDAVSGSISAADGSALVRLGDATIVCSAKAEIAEPDLDVGRPVLLAE